MVLSLRLFLLHVLLMTTVFRIQVDAKKASVFPQWDNPQVDNNLYFCVISVLLYSLVSLESPMSGRVFCAEQACEWDLKICGDGTWVYPDPEKNCAFPECWVAFRTPMSTPEYEVI